ncbi:UbiD family decarboxylase domain-containing protein, partial [Rhizobium leguminosarum]|uniref:UbiD family decarboxylase domain-containing protein n=1 Tax=Rhizobium leguminosarum TaxID=384 RepID=UPI003F984145
SSIASPVPPVFVDDSPVQQQLFQDDILTRLPVPTFFSKETGPYITAGLIVARDPADRHDAACLSRAGRIDLHDHVVPSA